MGAGRSTTPGWWPGLLGWRRPDRLLAYTTAIAREIYAVKHEIIRSRSRKLFGHCINFAETGQLSGKLASRLLSGHHWTKRETDVGEICQALVSIHEYVELIRFASNGDKPPDPATLCGMSGIIERGYTKLQSHARTILGGKSGVIETRWRLKDWLWERGRTVDLQLKAAVEACVIAGEIDAARQLVEPLVKLARAGAP
jgi:hypothetical protein